MSLLKDQVAIVTGASRGIGRAIALHAIVGGFNSPVVQEFYVMVIDTIKLIRGLGSFSFFRYRQDHNYASHVFIVALPIFTIVFCFCH